MEAIGITNVGFFDINILLVERFITTTALELNITWLVEAFALMHKKQLIKSVKIHLILILDSFLIEAKICFNYCIIFYR
jgi:hypothetical protein